jgi:hypothetical protein
MAKPADEFARQRRFEREGGGCSIISPPLNHRVGHEICCRTRYCHLMAELARLPVSTSAVAGAANAIAAAGIPETLVAVMAEMFGFFGGNASGQAIALIRSGRADKDSWRWH